MKEEERAKIRRFGKNLGFSDTIIEQALMLGSFREARNYLKELYLKRTVRRELRHLPVISPKSLSLSFILSFLDNLEN